MTWREEHEAYKAEMRKAAAARIAEGDGGVEVPLAFETAPQEDYERWRHDPVAFVREALGMEPWTDEMKARAEHDRRELRENGAISLDECLLGAYPERMDSALRRAKAAEARAEGYREAAMRLRGLWVRWAHVSMAPVHAAMARLASQNQRLQERNGELLKRARDAEALLRREEP